MYRSGSPYLVCEELTDVARHRIPEAVVCGVTGLFDYEGALPVVTGTATVLRTIADRLVGHAVRSTRAGSVFFLVRVAQTAVDRCDVVLDVADTSGGIDAERCDALNRALVGGAAAHPDLLRGLDDVLLAGELCRSCGGRLAVESLPDEGCVAQARVPVACLAPIGDERIGEADGATLWLIGQPALSYEPLVRRFQRHGWAVRPFVTAMQALAGLGEPGAGAPTPAMVVAIEHYGVEAASLAALRERLSAHVTMVLLVLHGAIARVAGAVAPGILLQALPFSPRQVLHFTELGRHVARGTVPGAADEGWRLQSRPRVLIADDDEVNRLIAVQVLRLLGFEAEAVEDGEALLAACDRAAPAAVLMDVEMPRLDGLAATRELRRRQQAGELAAFPVIAATGLASAVSRPACLAAGMSGYLRKPLHPAVLRNELLLCGVAAS